MGQVVKIRPEVQSTPEMLLGMLLGQSRRIKHIAAIILWDDDSSQLVNDPMQVSDLAWAHAIMRFELDTRIAQHYEGE